MKQPGEPAASARVSLSTEARSARRAVVVGGGGAETSGKRLTENRPGKAFSRSSKHPNADRPQKTTEAIKSLQN